MLVSLGRKAAPGKPLPKPSPPPSKIQTYQSPVRGWVTNENLALAQPGGALILDNFFPLRNSVRVRGGLLRHATVHATDPCETLMAYRSGTASTFFAATATTIYDVGSPGSPTVIPSASLTGQTNGDYSWVNYATAGGQFLLAVNGVDRMIYYDGSTWRRIDDATTELPFDAQTANYSGPGVTVTGGTSGATGVVVEILDNGATGTLRLKTVTGTFVDNELVTGGGGSATANIPTGVTAVPAITGALTSTFTDIWMFKSRVFLTKKDSLVAYALPINAIGGAVITVSMAGVMQRGGSLTMGATWSLDAGDGLDDKCVFISDQGEAAVYSGTDPSDALAWSLVGIYPMAELMHKSAHMRAGGDLLIVTKEGLLPISSAVNKDPAALSLTAISAPIEPSWRRYIAERLGKWTVGKWTARSMAIIGFPPDGGGNAECLALNLQTGAWSRFTGWDVRCALEFDGKLYIGTSQGKVYNCESSGTDDGAMYSCLYVGLHERLSNPTQEKVAHMCRATFRYSTNFNYRVSFAFNYAYSIGAYPPVPANSTSDLWDLGLWDVAKWDGRGIAQIITEWRSTFGRGFVVSPITQINMGTDSIPDVELISIDLLYEGGDIVT